MQNPDVEKTRNINRATNNLIGKAFAFTYDIPVTSNDLVDFNNVGIKSSGEPIKHWYYSKFIHKSRTGSSLCAEVLSDAMNETGIDYTKYHLLRPEGRSKGRYFNIEIIPYVLTRCSGMDFTPAFVSNMVQSYKNRNVSSANNLTSAILGHPGMTLTSTPAQSPASSRASTPAFSQYPVISQVKSEHIPIPYMALQVTDLDRRVSISNRESLSSAIFGGMSVSTYLPPNSLTLGPRLLQHIISGIPPVASILEIEKSLVSCTEFHLTATELQLIKADVHRLFGGIQNLGLMATVIRCLLTILKCKYTQVLGTRVLILSCIMPIVDAVDCISRLYSSAGVANDCRMVGLLSSAAKMSTSATFLREKTRRIIYDMNKECPHWFVSAYGMRWAEPLLWQDGITFIEILYIWTYIFESDNPMAGLCSLLIMHAIHFIETAPDVSVVETARLVERNASETSATDMIKSLMILAETAEYKQMNRHLIKIQLPKSLEDIRQLIQSLAVASEDEGEDEGEECEGLENCDNMVEYTCFNCNKRVCQACVEILHVGHRLSD